MRVQLQLLEGGVSTTVREVQLRAVQFHATILDKTNREGFPDQKMRDLFEKFMILIISVGKLAEKKLPEKEPHFLQC